MARHFGVLIPSTNTTVEMECRLLPATYQAHVGRLMSSGAGSVRALVELVAERTHQPPCRAPHDERPVCIVAGDFNAAPDADEIRLLTGRRPPALPGWVFLDAWETAGDGSPGFTMTKRNLNAAPLLLPDLRWDYVFVSWPSGPGGVGHPMHAEVVGTQARNGIVPSEHYAVLAELRY